MNFMWGKDFRFWLCAKVDRNICIGDFRDESNNFSEGYKIHTCIRFP